MNLAISRSAPFRRLQKRIGRSTYLLNTILVGLNCVSEGAGDAGAIAVTWTKPATPKDAKNTADQARNYACAGALVLAVDVFDSFLREFVREEWLGFAQETRDIATKAVTRKSSEGGDYSISERAQIVGHELEIVDDVGIAAIDLLVKWRNVVVHSTEQSARMESKKIEKLKEAEAFFEERYSHFDINLALSNFKNRRVPVPKEVTSLIALTVNFSRRLDEAAITRAAGTSDKILTVVKSILGNYPWPELSDAWQGPKDRRSEALKKYLAKAGITEGKDAISAPIPEGYLDQISSLSRNHFAEKFDIQQLR